ncbi:MAG TPA: prepilin peptidase [Candidatus Aquicultor sp.]|jgi:leader peptidase (prepilin peptidase)/N-methyltransferase
MVYILLILFFMVGSIIGSFLNVCAYRIPRSESIMFPGSHCPACGGAIAPYDNIPIVSYLLLRGTCRHCRGRIGIRYPLVELTTGALWAAVYYRFGLSSQLAGALFFVTVLTVLSAIDYDTKTLPDKLLLPSIGLSALALLLYPIQIDALPLIAGSGVLRAMFGFVAGGGLLLIVALLGMLVFKREAMGGGDIKLAAFMGLYLGGYVVLAIFIGTFLGTLAGTALMARGKAESKSSMPFGPFLAAGAIVTIFIGPQLWLGYLKFAGLA